MKTYRNHRGVKIYRIKELICGSDWKYNSKGVEVPATPQYDVYFQYAGGGWCYTLKECKMDIDDMFEATKDFDVTEKGLIQIMNTGKTYA